MRCSEFRCQKGDAFAHSALVVQKFCTTRSTRTLPQAFILLWVWTGIMGYGQMRTPLEKMMTTMDHVLMQCFVCFPEVMVFMVHKCASSTHAARTQPQRPRKQFWGSKNHSNIF